MVRKMKTSELQSRLEFRRASLEAARSAYLALLNGQVKQYSIGSRQLTKFDLPQLEDSIRKLEKEVDELEMSLSGKKRRMAAGVIPRDY